ncbi:hypothetical protein MAPG_12164, partial [Magnaporthiopsis poae ATCC 64411]
MNYWDFVHTLCVDLAGHADRRLSLETKPPPYSGRPQDRTLPPGGHQTRSTHTMMAARSSLSERASSRGPKRKPSASGPQSRGSAAAAAAAANNIIAEPLSEPISTTVIIMVSALLLALGLLATRHVNGIPAPLPDGPEDLQGDGVAAAAVSCNSQGITPILGSFSQAGVTLTLERASSVSAGGSFGEGAA